MQKMERKKHYGWGERKEAMGENTSPQRIQLVEMELKDRNDGKEMKTDNGLQAGPLSVFFYPFCSNTQFKPKNGDCSQICIGPPFVLSLSSCRIGVQTV